MFIVCLVLFVTVCKSILSTVGLWVGPYDRVIKYTNVTMPVQLAEFERQLLKNSRLLIQRQILL